MSDARLSEDARMARRVQALLAFKEQYVDTTVAAQVIGTSGSEQSRVLYIDKGSNDGIKTDMAVITPTGIVGKIVQVFPDSSQVLPINDQFSGVGAALKDSRLQGILKGAPNGATTLQYIMSDEKVEPGEEVITSGGDRIFPKGLPVGKVASVEPGKDLFLNIRVVPVGASRSGWKKCWSSPRSRRRCRTPRISGRFARPTFWPNGCRPFPTKPEVDAAGNAKPGAANAAAPEQLRRRTATAAHPARLELQPRPSQRPAVDGDSCQAQRTVRLARHADRHDDRNAEAAEACDSRNASCRDSAKPPNGAAAATAPASTSAPQLPSPANAAQRKTRRLRPSKPSRLRADAKPESAAANPAARRGAAATA